MQNYETALEYANVAAESSGTSYEKFGVYQDSAEAKTNQLIAAFEKLSATAIDSEWIKVAVEGLTGITEAGEKLIDTFGLIPTVLTGISIAMNAMGKNAGKLFMPSYQEKNFN